MISLMLDNFCVYYQDLRPWTQHSKGACLQCRKEIYLVQRTRENNDFVSQIFGWEEISEC